MGGLSPYSHSCGQLRPDQSHSCPGGLGPEVEGQGPGGSWVGRNGEEGTRKLEQGAAGSMEPLCHIKPRSLSLPPIPLGLSLPVFLPSLHLPKHSHDPHSYDTGTDLVPLLNKDKSVAEAVSDMQSGTETCG